MTDNWGTTTADQQQTPFTVMTLQNGGEFLAKHPLLFIYLLIDIKHFWCLASGICSRYYLARIIQFGGFYRNASKIVKSRNLAFIIARLLWLKLPLSLVKSPKLHFFESVQIRRLIDVFATLLLDYFFAISNCILYFRHSSLGPAFFETFKATDVRLKNFHEREEIIIESFKNLSIARPTSHRTFYDSL